MFSKSWKLLRSVPGRGWKDCERGGDRLFKFGDLFRGAARQPEDIPEEQTDREELQAAAPQPVPEQRTEEKHYFIEVGGDLRTLWTFWRGETLPPKLSLTDERGAEALHLEPGALERERLRMKLKLEKDAKLRCKLLRSFEEKGTTAALAATCSCTVSKDKRVAWLFVYPPTATGDGLKEEDVLRVLQKENVVFGVDPAAIQRALEEDHYFELIPVAVGQPPVEGQHGRIVELLPRESSKEIQVDDRGNADYRSQAYVQVVREDTVICDILLPVPGQEGKNVDGSPAAPKAVRAARVPKGEGTKFSEDGLHLLAARSGHLEYQQGRFCVRPVLEIPGDVDYSTGNVDFPGDVHIRGDVREGFRVFAEGSLMIDGLVEAADVAAGADLLITKGVVGDNRAVLHCGGNLRTKYLENCTVYVGKCVYADCAVTSAIYCDGSVSVTGGRGSIIGGSVTAGVMVKAKLLGARSGRQTELTLGTRPYTLQLAQESNRRLAELRKREQELEKDITYMQGHAGPGEAGDWRKRLDQAEANARRLKEEEQGLRKPSDRPDENVDLDRCGVECDTVYPITTISVDGSIWTIDTVRNYYKVGYNAKLGQLMERV